MKTKKSTSLQEIADQLEEKRKLEQLESDKKKVLAYLEKVKLPLTVLQISSEINIGNIQVLKSVNSLMDEHKIRLIVQKDKDLEVNQPHYYVSFK
ncbi:hypothetical protein [Mesobacillus foraminis]|uniref:Uncharacterized protein n=1 Tax=Mesobacillus foraminis TaxID=279826 RepID=A0A4R2BEV1_9BACI|nr:hypothetical protein [Mesobacillus foraminis]TCN25497.1 hypothetical protein EV146_105154 [Mesobacillus foraminis]